MNHGVVEQYGKPQDIYDWPATKFVAKFIGSPPMNFLDFDGMIGSGLDRVELDGVEIKVPQSLEGASGSLTLGVRPEHIHLSDEASYRGCVVATEYLGTTQIFTIETNNGIVKVRLASNVVASIGDNVGLEFDQRTLSVFDGEKGQALKSIANEEVLNYV